MNKFIVLHYSNNWMMDGLATFYFKSRTEAEKYISSFQGGTYHKDDKYIIVEIMEEGKASKIDDKVYGFKR